MEENKIFKVCPTCGFVWQSRNQFMTDKNISMMGYQVNFKDLAAGLFLFNHICRETFAMDVNTFKDLYKGFIFEGKATGSDVCPGFCLHKKELKPCPAKCECAFVREIVQILQAHKDQS